MGEVWAEWHCMMVGRLGAVRVLVQCMDITVFVSHANMIVFPHRIHSPVFDRQMTYPPPLSFHIPSLCSSWWKAGLPPVNISGAGCCMVHCYEHTHRKSGNNVCR